MLYNISETQMYFLCSTYKGVINIYAELYKLRKSIIFKIFIILDILISMIFLIAFKYADNTINLKDAIFECSVYSGPVHPFICGMFISLFVIDEYKNKTVSIILSKGIKRIEYLFYKLFGCIVGGLILIVFNMVMTTIFYIIIFGYDYSLNQLEIFNIIKVILLTLIVNVSIVSIYFMFAVLSLNTAVSTILVLFGINAIDFIITKIPMIKVISHINPFSLLYNITLDIGLITSLFLIGCSVVIPIICLILSYLVFSRLSLG